MKIVLRHCVTGRYYDGAGWVRRADNALTFETLCAAREFSRSRHLELKTQPVQRLAPYMMDLLRAPRQPAWASWGRRSSSLWYAARLSRFSAN